MAEPVSISPRPSPGPPVAETPSRGFGEKLLWTALFMPMILFSWQISSFQYSLYWPGWLGLPFTYASYLSIAVMAVFGLKDLLNRHSPLNMTYLVYALTCIFFYHILLEKVPATKMHLLMSCVVATGMLFVVARRERLEWFLWLNAGLGSVCVFLNSCVLLSFFGIVNLPYRMSERVGGGSVSDAVYLRDYGLFGRTEIGPDKLYLCRLQGWSFEPIHWAYFVFLTIACCLFLWGLSDWKMKKKVLLPMLLLSCVHLFFVQSTTAWIVFMMAAGLIGGFFVSRHALGNFAYILVFLCIVVVIGFLAPSLLATIPGVENFFYMETLFGEGANWENKLGFVSLGSDIFKRFLPNAQYAGGTAHNLIMNIYMAYGYLGLPLILWLEWEIIRTIVWTDNKMLQGAIILSLVVANHQAPEQLFYPSGAIWFLAAVAVMGYCRKKEEPQAEQAGIIDEYAAPDFRH